MDLIIAATDGSEGANRAVDTAAWLAKSSGDKLLLLTVGNSLDRNAVKSFAQAESVPKGDAAEEMLNDIVQRAKQRANEQGAPSVEVQVRWGDAAEVLLEAARSMSPDAIVIGKRGHGRLAGLLLGSLPQKLVSLAPCTVVVVP